MRLVVEDDFDEMLNIKIACVKIMHENGNIYQYLDDVNSYPSLSDFKNKLDKGHFYAVDIEGKIAGYYFLETKDESEYVRLGYKNTAAVHMLLVNPKYQGEGLASKMTEHAKQWAIENGRDYLMIDTHPTNKPLQGLAKKFNFEFIGEICWIPPKDEYSTRYCYALKLK